MSGDPNRHTPGTTPGNLRQQQDKEAYDFKFPAGKALSGKYIRDSIEANRKLLEKNKALRQAKSQTPPISPEMGRVLVAIVLALGLCVLLYLKFQT